MTYSDDTVTESPAMRNRPPELGPALFLALECERPLSGPSLHRLAGLQRVRIGRGSSRAVRRHGETLEIDVADARMSVEHAELVHDEGRWSVHDLGSKNGTFLGGNRTGSATLAEGALLQLGRTFFSFRARFQTPEGLDLSAEQLIPGPAGLTTFSPAFQETLDRAAAIAPSRVAVLIQGETGTGKEVLAHGLHKLSGRRGLFVAINCGALPANLVESELFGHRKGAFSGADQDRPGLVRTADGGTLFLDEVGDLPLPAQAALLRVLQECEVLAIGAGRPLPVDLRVISATHRDLQKMVQAETFRRDLLARLEGVALELQPLRERSEDVPLVVAALLRKLAPERPDVRLSPEAAQALLEYAWPLNVRELEQALAGGLALSRTGVIECEHLPRALRELGAEPTARELTSEETRHREGLEALLREHRGNLSAVARVLGKGRTQIVRWVSRYGIETESFRED